MTNSNVRKLLLATGAEMLDIEIKKFEGFEVIESIGYKNQLVDSVLKHRPDIVIVSDYLTGKEILVQEMILAKQKQPSLEVLYITKKVDTKNLARLAEISSLIMSGIYPLIVEEKIKPINILDVLKNPIEFSQVEKYLQYSQKDKKEETLFEIEIEEEEFEDVEQDGHKNVFVVSSIKPGTGKSFISTNIATSIAKFGKMPDGSKPKVAIIEADLQNLSVGTLLQIQDEKKNLKSAMDMIASIITPNDELIDDSIRIEEVNKFVISCFKEYQAVPNLKALVGSQFTMEEIEDIKPIHYVYLIDLVASEFDYVIIDSNSSLAHVTTYPLLRLASKTFYVLNLDYNNIKNNLRYRETLKNFDVYHKIQYILNEDYDVDYLKMFGVEEPEALSFTAKNIREFEVDKEKAFDLIGEIPMVPKSVFLNRLFDADPIVLDNKDWTVAPRLSFARICNQILPIDNLEWLEKENAKQLSKAKEKRGRFFGKQK